MRREDCLEMFKRIPEAAHAHINLVLQNQAVLAVDQVARFEPGYLVFRGREGGTTDEGRAFFVPYDDISYIKLEKVVRVSDLKRLYGEAVTDRELGSGEADGAAAAAKEPAAAAVDIQTPPPAPAPPMDPAAIAKQNLLDRIRAARTSATGSLTKSGK